MRTLSRAQLGGLPIAVLAYAESFANCLLSAWAGAGGSPRPPHGSALPFNLLVDATKSMAGFYVQPSSETNDFNAAMLYAVMGDAAARRPREELILNRFVTPGLMGLQPAGSLGTDNLKTRAKRAIKGIFLSAALCALSGCGQPPPPAPCLPVEVKALLDQDSPSSPPQSARVQVLFDGSGSMAGYLRAKGGDIRPIPDIVRMLQAIPSTRGDSVEFYQFGRAFHRITVADADRLADERAYACNGLAGCDNQESHIDTALQRAAQYTQGLTVIVTDLWLSSKDLSASHAVTINAQLSALFDDGRSVAIVGLRAPYRGRISDLPNGRQYDRETEHPLFVILVGSQRLIEAYRDEIAAMHSPAFAPDRMRESLFTPTPFAFKPDDLKLALVADGRGAVLNPQAVLPANFGAFRQFHVSNAVARAAGGDEGLARMTMPLDKRARRGAVWSGEFVGHARVWMQQEGAPGMIGGVCPQWLNFKDLPDAWRLERRVFTLDAKNDIALLPPDHTYLIAAWLEQTSLDSPNPADRWMHDWGFTLSNEDAVLAGKPAFFPTLNLEEMAVVLETRLGRSIASRHPAPKGTVVAVRLEN